MQPFGQSKEREKVGRRPRLSVASNYHSQCSKVEHGKKGLPEEDIAAFVGEVIEEGVNVYMGGGVDEGTG
jgi:hypothetical protein